MNIDREANMKHGSRLLTRFKLSCHRKNKVVFTKIRSNRARVALTTATIDCEKASGANRGCERRLDRWKEGRSWAVIVCQEIAISGCEKSNVTWQQIEVNTRLFSRRFTNRFDRDFTLNSNIPKRQDCFFFTDTRTNSLDKRNVSVQRFLLHALHFSWRRVRIADHFFRQTQTS